MFNLKKLFSKAPSGNTEATFKDLRRHERISLSPSLDAFLTLEGLPKLVLSDLSYGGTQAIVGGADASTLKQLVEKHQISGKITLLRDVYPIVLKISYIGDRAAGFCFIHEDPTFLLALRGVIEPLRWGQSLFAIPKDIAADRYKGDAWFCYRGDGPVDLVIKSESPGVISEFLMVFRRGKDYLEISWQHTKLRTSQNKEPNATGVSYSSAAQMVSTDELDQATIRMALWLISGMNTGVCPLQKALIERILPECK
jgi:hypothetical protein